jgi:hypothetical protein
MNSIAKWEFLAADRLIAKKLLRELNLIERFVRYGLSTGEFLSGFSEAAGVALLTSVANS